MSATDMNAEEPVDIFGSALKPRSDRERLAHYANRFREKLDNLDFYQQVRFDELMDAVNGLPDVVAAPASSVEAPDPVEPEPELAPVVVEYRDDHAYDPIRLQHPLTVDGLRVDEIAFSPPVFSDVEAVLKGEITEIELHARMANLPVAVFRALRWTDSEVVTFMARRLAPELRRH